jgi:quercetin dioxygenase-like cupin family protein
MKKTNRSDSVQVIKDLKKVRSEISKMANRVTHVFDKQLVDFNITEEWRSIAGNVNAIECVLNSPECTVINMVFDNGGFIPRHKHNRQEEIFVVSGEIHDSINDVHITQGGVYIIPPNKPHEIRSDKAKLTVVFRPPFPKVILNAKSS